MLGKVIVDTGILIAAIDRRDTHHDWVTEQLKHISPPLLTCEAVISETWFLSIETAADSLGSIASGTLRDGNPFEQFSYRLSIVHRS